MRTLLTVGVCAVLLSGVASARDLGRLGQVFPVAEQDLMLELKAKLSAWEAEGGAQRMQAESRAAVDRFVDGPPRIATVGKAVERRVFYYTPEAVSPVTIWNQHDELIVARGARVNVLEDTSLSKPIMFFDADDRGQVEAAKRLVDVYPRAVLILVGGSPSGMMQELQRPVFYDLHGFMTEKIGVQAVPAVVVQEGLRLRVTEVPL
jgi:conjugal transfer pilus assembly protein TraW